MRGVGVGKCVWRRKNKGKEKKRKENEKKRMDSRTEGNKNHKKNRKSQLNIIIIFSQYFTINFKYRLLLFNIGE